jgi:hypothetical protein
MNLDSPDTGLPEWAWVPVPDSDFAFIQAWTAAGAWPDRETAIRAYVQSFPGSTLPQSIETEPVIFSV